MATPTAIHPGGEERSFLLEAKGEEDGSKWMEALIGSRFSTISMERNLLRSQNEQFVAEIESLETQVKKGGADGTVCDRSPSLTAYVPSISVLTSSISYRSM